MTKAGEKLRDLVTAEIEKSGFEFEGKTWLAKSLENWANLAGVSTKTVRRAFEKEPFDTLRKLRDGRQVVYVRVGKSDPNQASRLAATMAKMFRHQTKRQVTPSEYGLLHGLVKDFRAGWQLEIFRYAISKEGWALTKALSKMKTEDLVTPLGKTGGTVQLLPGKAHLFQKYPHIPTLRLFWMCAEASFVDSKFNTDLTPHEREFFIDWAQEVNGTAFLDWEPNFKSTYDPIMDVKG